MHRFLGWAQDPQRDLCLYRLRDPVAVAYGRMIGQWTRQAVREEIEPVTCERTSRHQESEPKGFDGSERQTAEGLLIVRRLRRVPDHLTVGVDPQESDGRVLIRELDDIERYVRD